MLLSFLFMTAGDHWQNQWNIVFFTYCTDKVVVYLLFYLFQLEIGGIVKDI